MRKTLVSLTSLETGHVSKTRFYVVVIINATIILQKRVVYNYVRARAGVMTFDDDVGFCT